MAPVHINRAVSIPFLVAFLLIIASVALPSTITLDRSGSLALLEMATEHSTSPLDGLVLGLAQTSTSPPTVRVTVTNNNSHPVTIITYNSPLDGLALPLGLLSITPDGASDALELNIIKASRVWPPKPDSLVGLDAGAQATNDMVFKAPTVPMDKLGKKATVFLQGHWMGVFARAKDQVSAHDLDHLRSQPDVFEGDFKSESIEITID
jgi:hypothetical protein